MRNYRLASALGLASVAVVFGETLADTYRETAGKLIDAALTDNNGYEKLAYLCDRIGNRLSGSEGLTKAIAWAAGEMKRDGLANVSTPAVQVPHWVRGAESASLIEPVQRPLTMLGLGGSIGTPKNGITAEVVPVADFTEMEKLGRAGIAGKIVLFNVPYGGYGRTVVYRHNGASRAAALGAVAALVRSVTPVSLQSAHTGAMEYALNAPKIPAAALTIEDALLMQRFFDRGLKVVVHLTMEAQTLPDAPSANVIGEIPGRERPQEVVVIGGHIDSWDVGAGAQDDGSGCVVAMEAAHLIRQLGMTPRRTLRVVLWTNEENGGAGGEAYRKWIGDGIRNHVASIEMDGGAERPLGFGVSAGAKTQAALDRLHEAGKLLERIEADSLQAGGGGADIAPLMRDGVPGLSLQTTGAHYFDWHHSRADTTDKVDAADLRKNIAAMAVMAFILADMPDSLTGLPNAPSR